MAIYRIKISFEDYEGVYRIIDMKSNQTFEDLHKAILKSIDFKEGEFASFYLDYAGDDQDIEICLSDLQGDNEGLMLMANIKIGEIINDTLQNITYIYDFTELWNFRIEVIEKRDHSQDGFKYPTVIKSVGKAPLQSESNLLYNFSPEDSMIIKQLKRRNKDILLHPLEEEIFNEEELDELEDYDDDDKDF
jgi:hypothetical protein